MQMNTKLPAIHTHEGGKACHITPLMQLRRTILACLLWEKGFYESGQTIATRIQGLVPKCKPEDVAALAIEARDKQHLRHAPLFLMRELARNPRRCPQYLIRNTLARVIQRADELAEFLAIYWADGKVPLAKQVKLGLGRAFRKFNEYQLAKYNRDNKIKLRDVLFMVHARPIDEAQAELWKRLANNELATPDTWEVALSGGADKKETFTRLITEKKLGYMALLRNLRNMHQAGVDIGIVQQALWDGAPKSNALPFRFVAAARAVPQWEASIDTAMQLSMKSMARLPGRTIILVDVSASMDDILSSKSDLTRMDAASALAVLVRGICDEVLVLTFSSEVVHIPPRNGMALIDAIKYSQVHAGTYLKDALELLHRNKADAERTIVITDEQSHDGCGKPIGKGYIINVSHNKNGVGYGLWTHIDGFSEAVVSYIAALEEENDSNKQ